MNRENSFFNPDEPAKTGTLSSIKTARRQVRDDINSYSRGNEAAKYTKELEKQIDLLDRAEKTSGKLYKNEKENRSVMLDYLKKIREFGDVNNVNYKKFLNLLEDTSKVLQKQNRENYLNERITQDERMHNAEIYLALLEKIGEQQRDNEEAQKSQIDAFSDSIDKLKNEVKDLAVIKGIGDISSGLFDNKSSSSMLNVFRNTSSQLGITESQFNSFKLDLNKQLVNSYNLTNFGWKDTAEYLNKLGDLGITSQEMAKDQYLAVMTGTKYLGLQTDTQAKILKLSRDTGKQDLLQHTNETMVQIMNAQLGISKEQLNEMVNRSADIANIATFLGGDGSEAMDQLIKIQSAVANEYGQATSKAATDILTQILANPSGNQYLQSGFFGAEYNNIMGDIQNNRFDEAIKRIITSVQTSRSLQVARNNPYAMEALGVDSNIMAIGNASGNMQNVNNNMNSIANASKDIQKTISEFNKSWSDKILNAGSNILSMLPFSQVLTLQNAYYALALVQLLVNIPKTLGLMFKELKQISFNTGKSAVDIDSPTGGTSKVLGKLVAITSIISGISMGISDAKKATSKSEEWGTGKVSAAIGGFIGGSSSDDTKRIFSNIAKYAAIGAGIGALFFGIGAVPGALLGGFIGLALGATTGAVGGENIAKGLDSMFGNRKDTGTGEAPNSGTTSYGMGASGNSGGYPWTITSHFSPKRTLPNGDTRAHNGVDFGIKVGTKVGTPMSGTVSFIQRDNRNTYPNGPKGTGNGVNLIGDDGNIYQFWHLSAMNVKEGQRVQRGDLIGLSGNTGYSTGPHLHFGVKKNASTWVNPLNYINNGLFEANGQLIAVDNENTRLDDGFDMENATDVSTVLEKAISADTLSNQANATIYGQGAGLDSEGIIKSVNSGFAGLNDKLEELSNRQDTQEETLRAIVSKNNSALYQF